jgi:hypothetical protein
MIRREVDLQLTLGMKLCSFRYAVISNPFSFMEEGQVVDVGILGLCD